MLQQPDVLVLDEPTIHLDIPTCEVLEEALLEFTGTVLCVSHDRYFLDRTMTRLLLMRKENCQVYAGNYSYYLEHCRQACSGTPLSSPLTKGGKRGVDRHTITDSALAKTEKRRRPESASPTQGAKTGRVARVVPTWALDSSDVGRVQDPTRSRSLREGIEPFSLHGKW